MTANRGPHSRVHRRPGARVVTGQGADALLDGVTPRNLRIKEHPRRCDMGRPLATGCSDGIQSSRSTWHRSWRRNHDAALTYPRGHCDFVGLTDRHGASVSPAQVDEISKSRRLARVSAHDAMSAPATNGIVETCMPTRRGRPPGLPGGTAAWPSHPTPVFNCYQKRSWAQRLSGV